MKSCLMLTVEAIGHKITTIEGLKNTVVQDAFIMHLAFQCGYCTLGFIMNIGGSSISIPTQKKMLSGIGDVQYLPMYQL